MNDATEESERFGMLWRSRPGGYEVHKFGIPSKAVCLQTVVLRKITIDSDVELG